MRKLLLGITVLLLILLVTGCDWQADYTLGEQIEFLPESGADQYVMGSALLKAVQQFDFQKYSHKKVYLTVMGGTPFTQGIVKNLTAEKLRQAKAGILVALSDNDKAKGLKEEPGDFVLEMNILTCGVHSYDGLVRKNIMGLARLSLHEIGKDGVPVDYPGVLQRYSYEQWVFSPYFIVALLALMVLSLVILLRRVLR